MEPSMVKVPDPAVTVEEPVTVRVAPLSTMIAPLNRMRLCTVRVFPVVTLRVGLARTVLEPRVRDPVKEAAASTVTS